MFFFVGLLFYVCSSLQYFLLLTLCVVLLCVFIFSDSNGLIIAEAPAETSEVPLPAATKAGKLEM